MYKFISLFYRIFDKISRIKDLWVFDFYGCRYFMEWERRRQPANKLCVQTSIWSYLISLPIHCLRRQPTSHMPNSWVCCSRQFILSRTVALRLPCVAGGSVSASAGGEGRGGRGQLRGEEAREERGGVRPAHGLRGRRRLRGGRQWVSLLVHHIILVYIYNKGVSYVCLYVRRSIS